MPSRLTLTLTLTSNIHNTQIEIYNDEVRDLLDVTTGSHSQSANSEKSKIKISNLKGFVTIDGVTTHELNTSELKAGLEEFENLSNCAAKSRVTLCTTMNERSSRSHALFMFDIHAKHRSGLKSLKGGLRLVDLAGSERLDRTGHVTDPARLKETVNINKSLSSLADVFIALGNKSTHIPYRNSKLTMVLQVRIDYDVSYSKSKMIFEFKRISTDYCHSKNKIS